MSLNFNRIGDLMKKLVFSLMSSLIFFLTLLPLTSSAQISFGIPAVGGSGCSEENTTVSLESNGQVRIQFSDFMAAVTRRNGLRLDRKFCAISIPVSVPEGYRLSITPPSILGSYKLGKSSLALVHSEIFFPGFAGPVFHKIWKTPTSGNFVLNQNPSADDELLTECGTSVVVRVNLSATVERRDETQNTRVAVHSLGGANGFKINYEKCD